MPENDKNNLSKPKNYYVTDLGIFAFKLLKKINQIPLIRNYHFSNIISSKKFQKVFLLTGIPLLLFLIVWKVPQSQIPNDPSISVQEKITLEDKARGTLIQVFGGLFFFVTAYFTWRNSEISHKQLIATQDKLELEKKTAEENLELANAKQITERFSKAVEQLGNESITIRLGGIFALERIAKNSKDDHWTIMEVLTAFVREKSKNREPNLKIPQDIQAALTVIGRRNTQNDLENGIIDLSGSNLNRANLSEAKLDQANFDYAELNRAIFFNTNLDNASFLNANLDRANFCEAKLDNANFFNANLDNAGFVKANLTRASFWAANITKANFNEADLTKTNFCQADLTKTNFEKATLVDAMFDGAKLYKTKLHEADIKRASFLNMGEELYITNYLESPIIDYIENLTIDQILEAKNWDKAKYNPDFERQLQVYLLALIFRIYKNTNLLNSAFLKKIILNRLPIIT